MRRELLFYFMLIAICPLPARADYIVEFTDGRKVTVGHYIEKGSTIEIYTSQGTIGFRKEDIKQITAIDTNRSAYTPLETMSARPLSSSQTPLPSLSGGDEKGTDLDKSMESATKEKEAGAEARLEQIDEQYQDAAQELNRVWEKHIQDVNSGASDEILAENRRQLDKLNLERHKLIKAARKTNPHDLPAWAQ